MSSAFKGSRRSRGVEYRSLDFSKLGIFTRVYADRSRRGEIHRESGKLRPGHLQRIERKVPGEVALFVSDNGPKKRRKETGCLLEKVHGDLRERERRKKLGKARPTIGKLSFPRRILPSRLVHLFISCEGCAGTYVIEMKFLINK